MYNDSQYFYIKANDTLPSLQIMLMSKGSLDQVLPFNLSGVTASTFSMSDNSGNLRISSKAAQIVDRCKGLIQYNWTRQDTAQPGKYNAEFELFFSGGTTQQKMTVPLFGQINVEIFKDINKK
jgi:hypothetical protein